MPVSEQSKIWLEVAFWAISLLSAVWFFLQGYINIKTGKVSRFGLDTFIHFLDTRYWTKEKNPNWDNPKKIRLTGLMALALAVVLAKTSIDVFINFISPHLK